MSDIYKVLRQCCICLRVYNLHPTQQAIQLISSFSQLVALDLFATAGKSAELSDSLTNLTSLEELAAYHFPEFPVQFSCLSALTKLRIAPSSTTPHDLSAFSQLQYLWFGLQWSNMCTSVILPCGLDNSLQTLVAASDCLLYNLGSAVNLTELIVQDSHFEEMDWPTNLVSLQRLQVQQPAEQYGERGQGYQYMPSEWQHYTSLQTLILGPYEPSHSRQMPE